MTRKGLPHAGRDAFLSREAILRSAAELFAEHGYASTTLEDIGRRAGLSRGAPGYQFGSKDKLYAAVVSRVFSEARDALLLARDEAAEAELDGRQGFTYAVGAYIDFLASHADFVRLVEWEALGHGDGLRGASPHLDMVMAALDSIGEALAPELPAGFDLTQLMLSIAGLCWFPIAHRETLGRVLQVDPLDRSFIQARKQHVVDLVVHGISGSGRREERTCSDQASG
ncbi:MAG: TetR/AcrR family transcriptional regulator [Solirubrobacteraceae bacterium]